MSNQIKTTMKNNRRHELKTINYHLTPESFQIITVHAKIMVTCKFYI